MIILIFLVLFVIMIVMLLNAGGQTIAAKETYKVAIGAELQERDRVSSLLEFELFKLVKEQSFKERLPCSWEAVEKDAVKLGLHSTELYVLHGRPDLWCKDAEEWVLKNTKANLEAAIPVIYMVRLNLAKLVLKEKLGNYEYSITEKRLNESFKPNPWRGTGRLPLEEWCKLPLEKWSQDWEEWQEDLEQWLEIYNEEVSKTLYNKR